jgi:hypothetical protein
MGAPAPAVAAQEQGGAPTSLERVKERLETPVSRPLTPSVPVHLRPVFKSGVEKHPFVLTLDQDLHKTFDLNELQRQSAMWSARCCGIDLAQVYKAIGKSLYDRRVSQTREEIAKELAELQAARAAAGIK